MATRSAHAPIVSNVVMVCISHYIAMLDVNNPQTRQTALQERLNLETPLILSLFSEASIEVFYA
jgi:hypothetical protein